MGSGAAEELPVTWAARTERTDGKTSPEKLAAAAHSACYAMALALRLGERKAVPQRLAITATVTLDEAWTRTMTFNPDDQVLLGEFLMDPRVFQVTEKDGIVTLAGRPETNETGHNMVWRVRHAGGVVAVRDRLDSPPPERPGDRYDVLARFPMD